MSLKTWREEFYPITALQAHKTLNLVELVEHSIRKWIGLRPKNLKKHGVRAWLRGIVDSNENYFAVGAATCSLCRRFQNVGKPASDKDCVGCPLFESRNKVKCFQYAEGEKEYDSPYGFWQWESNPEPMIKALRKALKWAKKNS